MKRFQLKKGYTVHGEKGSLRGPDTFPEDWLAEEHLADLLDAGLVTEVKEEPPASPAAENTEQPGRTGRKGR